MDVTQPLFPQGNAVPSTKILSIRQPKDFSIHAFYTEEGDTASQTIGNYKIGPFKPADGKDRAKIKVQLSLTLHSTVVIDSAVQVIEEEYEEQVLVKQEAPAKDAKAA